MVSKYLRFKYESINKNNMYTIKINIVHTICEHENICISILFERLLKYFI